jgi:hypothetical protein
VGNCPGRPGKVGLYYALWSRYPRQLYQPPMARGSMNWMNAATLIGGRKPMVIVEVATLTVMAGKNALRRPLVLSRRPFFGDDVPARQK